MVTKLHEQLIDFSSNWELMLYNLIIKIIINMNRYQNNYNENKKQLTQIDLIDE